MRQTTQRITQQKIHLAIRPIKSKLSLYFRQMVRIFFILALLLVGVGCQSEMQLVVDRESADYDLNSIAYCSNAHCVNDNQQLITDIQMNNLVLLYLDLRQAGGMRLVSRLKEKSIIEAKIIIETLEGKQVGAAQINWKLVKYKIVKETYFTGIPIQASESEAQRQRYLNLSELSKNPFAVTIETIEYQDNEIIPQILVIDPNSLGEDRRCLIYIKFAMIDRNLTKSPEIDKDRNIVQYNEVNQTWANISTKPRLIRFR